MYMYTDQTSKCYLDLSPISCRETMLPAVCLSLCLSVCLSLCLSLLPAVCLSVCLSLCLSVRLFC